MVIRTYTFGVRFRKGFDGEMLPRQAGMDRYVYNKLLNTFQNEYRRNGIVNTTRGRINAWYTDLRNETGPCWLKRSVSGITRQTLYALGRHYSQYVETERAKAVGTKPDTEWGEPHFKKHGARISIPLTISHDGTTGQARFTGDRTIRIQKMGDIGLSRSFPVLHYRPKTARLFQTHDCKWRITISCEVPDPEPHRGEPVIIGVDRNIWNISTPDYIIVPPNIMIRRIENAENTAGRAQRIADRRQKPNHALRKPGSRRWAKAAKRVARNKRRAADLRHTLVHKASSVVADNSTHAVLEKLPLQNMARSAKGTRENPGTNVRQKSGMNKAILYQCWGMLARLLEYKLAGHVLWVVAAYTSQTCSVCGFADKKNRNGRVFLCLSCWYLVHADRNAARNIEDAGIRNIGRPARRGKLALRAKHTISDFPATPAGSAHVKGHLDAEGSCVGSPMNRQAPTGMWPSGTVTLWHDV